MKNKIVAVVVTYNRKDMLKECITALLNQTYHDLDIMVIDNCSTDGTISLVKNINDSRVIYINTGENLGGAGGFQFGIREALERHYEYFWLMDDDSIPTTRALDGLIKAAQKIKNYGFLSSKVLWKDHSLCKMNIPKVTINKKLDNFDGKPSRIAMATFVSFFVPAKVVKKVGLPIKEFFIWADDLEFSRRISRKYPCYFIPDSIIIHKCKTNNGSNIITDEPDRLNRYQYAFRNEVYVYRREGVVGWLRIIAKPIVQTGKVLLHSKSQKKRRIRIIIRSTFNGFRFKPGIEYYKES